ncbi:MAG: SH3 domain-containing protein [Amaricoccus sp.]
MAIGSGLVRALLLAGAVVLAAGADTVRQERIAFAPGASSATVEGGVAGFDSVQYAVAAAAGQVMTVGLEAANASTYLNVYGPGDVPGQSTALHVGAREGNDWTARLRASGDYTVQVFLIRAAARRNETAQYKLTVAITGEPVEGAAPAQKRMERGGAAPQPAPDFADGLAGGPDYWEVAGVGAGDRLNLRAEPSTQAPVLAQFDNGAVLRNAGCRMQGTQRWCRVEAKDPSVEGWVSGRYLKEASAPAAEAPSAGPAPGGDARVEGTAYNATGEVACVLAAGEPAVQCPFGVVRQGSGRASVTITKPDGTSRTIFFVAGKATGSDASQTGGGSFAAMRQGADLTVVAIGDERYEIPDAVVWGG